MNLALTPVSDSVLREQQCKVGVYTEGDPAAAVWLREEVLHAAHWLGPGGNAVS